MKQIAGQLGVCTQTARVHGNRVMSKMAARSIADLVRMVDKLGARCHHKNGFPIGNGVSLRPGAGTIVASRGNYCLS